MICVCKQTKSRSTDLEVERCLEQVAYLLLYMLAPEGNTGSPFQVILIPNQVSGSQIAKFPVRTGMHTGPVQMVPTNEHVSTLL